ncbi:MAG: hypothetical protein JJ976_09220 [Rhodothermales bacterium]|nr:hypothetical protein [Rhodothermales bacterium]
MERHARRIREFDHWKHRKYVADVPFASPSEAIARFMASEQFHDWLSGPEPETPEAAAAHEKRLEGQRLQFEEGRAQKPHLYAAEVHETPPVHGPLLISQLSESSYREVSGVEATRLFRDHLMAQGLFEQPAELAPLIDELAQGHTLFWLVKDPEDPDLRLSYHMFDHFAELLAIGEQVIHLVMVARD